MALRRRCGDARSSVLIILKASSEPHVTVHGSKKRRHMQHVENELAVTVAHYNGGGAFALCH